MKHLRMLSMVALLLAALLVTTGCDFSGDAKHTDTCLVEQKRNEASIQIQILALQLEGTKRLQALQERVIKACIDSGMVPVIGFNSGGNIDCKPRPK